MSTYAHVIKAVPGMGGGGGGTVITRFYFFILITRKLLLKIFTEHLSHTNGSVRFFGQMFCVGNGDAMSRF